MFLHSKLRFHSFKYITKFGIKIYDKFSSRLLIVIVLKIVIAINEYYKQI